MTIEFAYMMYVCLIGAAFGISYKYGSFMVRKTGIFVPHVFTSSSMYIASVTIAMISWFYYSWGVNEFLFVSGLMLGFALMLVGVAALLTLFFIKRKQWSELFKEGI